MNQDVDTEELKEWRQAIDSLDQDLIDLLAKRFKIVRAVGEYKAKHGYSVVQPIRAEAVKSNAAAMAEAKGLDPNFIRAFYEMMIEQAHKEENESLKQ